MDDRTAQKISSAKRWNIAPPEPGTADLAGRLKVSPIVAQILLSRGFRELQDCEQFLKPTLKSLHDPALLPGLSRAAERIAQAIADHQRIVIYGDYDVDGITATAILWHAIRTLGGSADFYIPHRIDEGYGINSDAIRQICDEGAKLIITVDCGITAIEPAKIAAERSVDLIITDHHEWKTSGERAEPHSNDQAAATEKSGAATCVEPAPLLPACHTIVHPRLATEGPPYPNPHLCGAGVAFKLAWGIGMAVSGANRVSESFRAFLLDATAFAALGTIADVVPLVGENRVLAHFGLGGLKASKLVGIRALIESAALTGQNLDSFHVGFLLAPRLNACGRMGHARLAVEMMTSADEKKALEIATYLEQQNRARQAVERQILDEAIGQITDNNFAADGRCAIVLGSEGWHPGVIGIVASRIVDRYHRPTVMIGLTNGHGQGSARSIAGFHLAQALQACGEHLETSGGHEMAAGLKLETAKLEQFRAAFCAHAATVLRPEQLTRELSIDAVGELADFTPALIKDLNRLGPFGQGNRRPLLLCRGLTVSGPPRRCGKTGDHLQLHVRKGEHFIKCIAFGAGNLESSLRVGTEVDLVVEPVINDFNGKSSVELQVKDLQFPGGLK